MLGVVWLIRDTHLDPVLESRHPACNDRIQEECDGSLRHCFVSANVLIAQLKLLDGDRT